MAWLCLFYTSIRNIDLSVFRELTLTSLAGCESLKSIDLSRCNKLTSLSTKRFHFFYIIRDFFIGCINAEVKLPKSIIKIENDVFGEDSESYCKKVLVPNETIKQLVIDSGYPEKRIEMY